MHNAKSYKPTNIPFVEHKIRELIVPPVNVVCVVCHTQVSKRQSVAHRGGRACRSHSEVLVQQPGPRQISDKQHLLEIAGSVRPGQKIKVRFKTEGIPELLYLVGMDGTIVMVNSSDHMVILAVIQSNDWDGERNRTIEMEALAGFDPDWFAGRLWRGLESAQVL